MPWTPVDMQVATEVRASLVELRLAAAAAEESRARGRAETAALVMHDLGNQLTGVYGWSLEITRELAHARANVRDPETLPELLTIERHVDKLGNCLTSALELLRINQRYALKGVPNPLGEGYAFRLEELLEQLDALFPQRCIRKGGKFAIATALPHGTGLAIDRTRFIRILLNLVKNSVEACDSARVAPLIRLTVTHKTPWLEFTLDDNGIGFTLEAAAELFQRGHTTKAQGHGLGLCACKTLLEAMGGALSLQSPGPGKGCTARILLPDSLMQKMAPTFPTVTVHPVSAR